jgi:Carboxypeptidase regulatory-like domain
MRTHQLCAVTLLLALAIAGIPAVYGQTVTATLTGTVTDQTGAVVPGVTVTAKNQGTELEYTAESSAAGAYTIPFLPVGNYVVSAEMTGFKKYVTNPIKLEVNQTARVDLKMELGQLSDTISVTGVAPILQTEAPVVGNVISGRTTTNLPLNGRNFQQLTLLVPGTINPNPAGFNGVGQQTQGRPYVNGNREQGNAFLLDGVSVDETIDNRIGYKPNVDAIEEFRVETSNSSAEFGNVTGATINATLKSGTNKFHGNLFEFMRNDAFDAQSWANNRSGTTTKAKLRQNAEGVLEIASRSTEQFQNHGIFRRGNRYDQSLKVDPMDSFEDSGRDASDSGDYVNLVWIFPRSHFDSYHAFDGIIGISRSLIKAYPRLLQPLDQTRHVSRATEKIKILRGAYLSPGSYRIPSDHGVSDLFIA